jgi:hypothetical protein
MHARSELAVNTATGESQPNLMTWQFASERRQSLAAAVKQLT